MQRPEFKVFCSGHKHAWLMWKVCHKAYRHELLQILISCYKCSDFLKIIISLKCEYLKDRSCRSTNVVLDILVNCFFQPNWGNLRHFFKDCMVICQGKSIIRVRARYLSQWYYSTENASHLPQSSKMACSDPFDPCCFKNLCAFRDATTLLKFLTKLFLGNS